jgi:hypothetical protein
MTTPDIRAALARWGRPTTPPAPNATQPPNALPSRVLAMCKKRGWDLSWSSRGVYLHLEASELIEALRGKHGDPLSEAADVLLVLMSITENAGIPWCDVLNQTAMTCARLEVCDPYPGEERGTLTQPAPAPAVVPVAVSERLPGPEDCDEDGFCWMGYGYRLPGENEKDSYAMWMLMPSEESSGEVWCPAHSIPLPQAGEGEA